MANVSSSRNETKLCNMEKKTRMIGCYLAAATAFVAFALQPQSASAFSANIFMAPFQRRHRHTSTFLEKRLGNTQHQMCICIDCARVTNCQAYHFVETKHSQPHMTEDPTFMPRDGSPTIHVNVRTVRNNEDRKKEMERMWKEHTTETEQAEAAADDKDGPLYGKEKYDFSPVTTYEYDVVACADFVEDKGAWVRNMPQEIKDANPNFVPS